MLRREAEAELQRPVVTDPVTEPDVAPPVDDPTGADMVDPDVPDWWSRHDTQLLKMTFGDRFQVVGPLLGARKGSFGRMLMAVDLDADQVSDDRYVVIKAVQLPEDDPGALRGFVKNIFGTTQGKMWRKEIDAASKLHHRVARRSR